MVPPICIHQHKDKRYTLDQHCYILITLQHYNPNSEFPERETPFPPDYTFSKDNRPVTDHDKHIIEEQHKRLPFCSAVCKLLYLAYNTRADILFAVCNVRAYLSRSRSLRLASLTTVPSPTHTVYIYLVRGRVTYLSYAVTNVHWILLS